MTPSPGFDHYAENYDAALAQGISVSGENKDYFAHGRLAWLSKRLRQRQAQIKTVMDFGCGTGSATPYLFEVIKAASVLGLDISASSLQMARQSYGSARTPQISRA